MVLRVLFISTSTQLRMTTLLPSLNRWEFPQQKQMVLPNINRRNCFLWVDKEWYREKNPTNNRRSICCVQRRNSSLTEDYACCVAEFVTEPDKAPPWLRNHVLSSQMGNVAFVSWEAIRIRKFPGRTWFLFFANTTWSCTVLRFEAQWAETLPVTFSGPWAFYLIPLSYLWAATSVCPELPAFYRS